MSKPVKESTETEKIEAKELHKPIKRKYERRMVVVPGVNHTWVADLVFMQKFEKENKHYKYILTVMDVLSRYAWAEPLKNKEYSTVINAFQKILAEAGTAPTKLWVDKGSEFVNKIMTNFLKPIEVYHTYSEHKAAPIERFNRTLKTRMWYKFTKHDTHKWVDRLPKLIAKYNKTVHSSIGMTPEKALKHEDELLSIQLCQLQRRENKDRRISKLKVGDMVRLSKTKTAFDKGYTENYTHELYRIVEVVDSVPNTYHVEDEGGNRIEGSFYADELQKSKLNWSDYV